MTQDAGSRGHPALTDAQTGLPNRLHWDTVFGVVFAAGSRGIPLTLILVEVDRYRDWIHGLDPADVDETFTSIGKTFLNTTRQSDLVARTDEGRFALLLLDCNLAGGRLVADRLDALLNPIRESTGIGFSMGVATLNRDMTRAEDLLGEAEFALQVAQVRGENQMEFSG